MRPVPRTLLVTCVIAVPVALLAGPGCSPWDEAHVAQLGPRPLYLVEDMDAGPLKEALRQCRDGPFQRTLFSIGHRGAVLQFPEHTKESYEAAAAMGAGVIECDVTFTADKALVCRHAQCDLHTSTDILTTSLAGKCSEPFTPATFDARGDPVTRASARCCTSDITLAEFKTLRGKMDGFDPAARTPREYVEGTPGWRTDLYAGSGSLLSHRESIELLHALGVKMTPELKSPTVAMPFDGLSRQQYAQRLIDEYRQAGVPAEDVRVQSFNLEDVLYWLEHEPDFGANAVFLDGRYEDPGFDHRDPATWSPGMEELAATGVSTIAPPLWMLLEAADGRIVPSRYAEAASAAGLDIITWTLEREGPLASGGGWYLQTLNGMNPHPDRVDAPGVIDNDGDIYEVLDVLARQVGIVGIFSDWPATVTYYANCMKLN